MRISSGKYVDKYGIASKEEFDDFEVEKGRILVDFFQSARLCEIRGEEFDEGTANCSVCKEYLVELEDYAPIFWAHSVRGDLFFHPECLIELKKELIRKV